MRGFRAAVKVADFTASLTAEGVDIALLQETNIHPTAHTNAFNHLDVPDDWAFGIPGKAATDTNRGKGIGIMVTSAVVANDPTFSGHLLKLTRETVEPSFELLAGVVGNLTVVNIYIHCSTTSTNGHLQPFQHGDYAALRVALESVPGITSGNVVVGGDFNFPRFRAVLEREVMAPLGLEPAHDTLGQDALPTRRGTALDLFYWRGETIRPVSMRAVDNAGSDHAMLILELEGVNLTSMLSPGERPPPLPRWTNLNTMLTPECEEQRLAMTQDARAALAHAAMAPDPITAASAALMQVAIKHLGVKRCHAQVRQAWWSHKLTRLHRKLRRARTKASAPSASPEDVAQATEIQHAFHQECQAARRRLNASLAQKFVAGDINLAWLQTGRHRGKKTARYLRRVAANPDDMINFWQGHFTDLNYPRPPAPEPEPHQPPLFTEFDINQAVLNMEDKTPGPDGLRVAMLKILGEDVAALLAGIFNRTSRQGIGDQAKTSFTIFIKKRGGSSTTPSDYRPIALQPVMTKVLEKLIEAKIWQQIKAKQVRLSDDQGGFVPGRSRFDLIFLVRCIQDNHQRQRLRKALYAAFLDVSKAYDSVPHIKIVESLRSVGVQVEIVRLVLDLLTNRYTTIYGQRVLITKGVPQGGPLSPLLFILAMMQPLSDAMAQHVGGGTCLPGEFRVKVLFYADDIFLVAESEEELSAMLRVCERWAASVGLCFNVPKSKLMLLAGKQPKCQPLPTILLDSQPLDWVTQFKYLGFPIYGSLVKQPRFYPLDMSLLNPVLYPLTSVLVPQQVAQLHLLSRVRVLTTMVESKVLHNSPLLDLDYKAMDRFLNRWLAVVCGMSINASSATFIRCELGVLPAQLIAERNALYFLWHLSHESWFRHCLPQFTHLSPLVRLTNMLISYGLSCEELYVMDLPAWRKAVKQAVLHKALSFYEPKQRQIGSRLPGFFFEYLGRPYLHHPRVSELADLAIQVRADRMPGIPQPYEYHPCLWCGTASAMNGQHLLRCTCMPADLAKEREELRQQVGVHISLSQLAERVVRCSVPVTPIPGTSQDVDILRQGLLLFRKISQVVKKQMETPSLQRTTWISDSLVHLFDVGDDALPELQAAVANDSLST